MKTIIQLLAEELGCAAGTNEEVARACRLIFLGVKPQVMGEMLASLTPVLKEREDCFVLVTMAAGLTCARIREMAGVDCPVIRVMPNPRPSARGCSSSAAWGPRRRIWPPSET